MVNEKKICDVDLSHAKGPFAGKISLIRDLVLKDDNKNAIKKVYLFGSYAYGEPDEDSDVDLCVIIDDKYDEINMDIALEIKRRLCHNKIFPTDLLVIPETYFNQHKGGRGVEHTINEEGKLLYG